MDSEQPGIPTTDDRSSAAGPPPGVEWDAAPSGPDSHGAPLIEVIAELGFADPGTIAHAVEATRKTEGTPEDYLLERGAIDQRQFSMALAQRSGLDYVDLDRFEVDPGAVAMIGKAAAVRYTALPVAFATDGALVVAIDDPYNTQGIRAIEEMTRSEVRPVIAAGGQVRRLADELLEETPRPPSEPSPLQDDAAYEESEPPPLQDDSVYAESEPPPEPPEPPVAMPPDPVPERNGSDRNGGEQAVGEMAGLSAAVENLIGVVEQAWRQSTERERELEHRLDEVRERIAALEAMRQS